jgi:hypothetical protein
MRLEDALRLKRGAIVVAVSPSRSPAITEGKSYTLLNDAIPFYLGLKNSFMLGSHNKSRPDDTPCSADFDVLDDRGDRAVIPYTKFVLQQLQQSSQR